MRSPETAKLRASRIPYDYERRGDRLIRWRIGLTWAALAGVGLWLAWGLVDGGTARARASHGRLVRAHAIWESRCDACHVPPPGIRLADWRGEIGIASAAGDEKCRSCHMGRPEQAHHPNRKTEGATHCASCHRDHAGPDASLVRRDEGQCTSCHAALEKYLDGPPSLNGLARQVRHFYDGSHPGFRSAAADPGRLKFNHYLHMSKGLKFREDHSEIFTYARLAPGDRPRYGWREGMGRGEPVRIEDCSACHAPAAGGGPAGAGPSGARRGQADMAPISFERHCAACHTLDVPGPSPGRDADEGDPVRVRHGLQPAEIHALLEASYFGRKLREDPDVLAGPSADAGPAWRSRADSARREVEGRVEAAQRLLFGNGKGTCTECHAYRDRSSKPATGSDVAADPGRYEVVPTAVPSSWFALATFDHAAHRAVDCRSCHPAAYPDHPGASGRPGPSGVGGVRLADGRQTWQASEDVLIPGIATCRECHSPPREAGGQPLGGASVDCAECHTYHDGAHPRAGQGAEARAARGRRDIPRLLLGHERRGN